MTTGIYALYWEASSMVYIGKSTNIDNRFYNHIRYMTNNSHPNYKISKQYLTHGKPLLIILETCSPSELSVKEANWINEFNSIKEGLNITDADGVSYYGTNTSKSIYSRKTILKVFSLLYKGNMYLKDIAAKLNVNLSLPTNICYNNQHTWLQEEYPEQYEKMLKLNCTRQRKSKMGLNNPMSYYTKRQILKVFSLLYKTSLSRTKIATRTKTKDSLAKSICQMGSHSWLKQEYPEQYSLMLLKRKPYV